MKFKFNLVPDTRKAPKRDARAQAIIDRASGVIHRPLDERLTHDLCADLTAACDYWIASHPHLSRTFFTAHGESETPLALRAYLREAVAEVRLKLEQDLAQPSCYTLLDDTL